MIQPLEHPCRTAGVRKETTSMPSNNFTITRHHASQISPILRKLLQNYPLFLRDQLNILDEDRSIVPGLQQSLYCFCLIGEERCDHLPLVSARRNTSPCVTAGKTRSHTVNCKSTVHPVDGCPDWTMQWTHLVSGKSFEMTKNVMSTPD